MQHWIPSVQSPWQEGFLANAGPLAANDRAIYCRAAGRQMMFARSAAAEWYTDNCQYPRPLSQERRP